MMIINRRYQLLAPDGDDSNGIYYSAIDLTNQREMVRIKLLNQETPIQELVRQFSDSFIQIAAADHENILPSLRFDIITTIDNRPIEGKRYFYVTGHYLTKDVITYTQLTLEERQFVLQEICHALQFLHFRGIPYKYLTFDNLLITRSSEGQLQVRLKDLASLYGYLDQGLSEIDRSMQTLAPEILMREPGSFASDIYALGVMAYFLLTGNDIRHHAFDRTRTYSSNKVVQRMIENATSPHPEERTPTIASFVQDYGQYCEIPFTFKDKKYYERLNFNIKLVGRDRELQQVKQLIAYRLQSMTGSCGVFISGEAGQGKSRFIREVHYHQRILGNRGVVLEVEKDKPGHHDNFGALLLDLVRQYAIPKNLIDRFGPELVKIAPALRDMWQVQPSEPLTGEREVLRLNNRIVSFIVEFSQLMPLVLYFDNIEDLCDNEFMILEHLLALNDNLPLVIIAAFAELTAGRNSVVLGHIQSGSYQMIHLESFGIDDAAQHLQQVLFMDKRPLQLATKILSEGSGNPRYIEEVVRNLFVRNYIYIHEARKWHINADGYGFVVLPVSLDDAVMSGIKRLDRISQRILQALAVFGKPAPKAVLVSLAKISEDVFDAKASHLLELKVLQIKLSDWGYNFDFYNRNVARTLYNALSEKRKSHFHLKAAALLEAMYIEDGTQGEALVKHLVAANSQLKAIEYAIKLGDRMNALAIYTQALEYYQQALKLFEHFSENQLKGRLLKAIADIYFQTGESQLALDYYRRLITLAQENDMTESKVDALLKIAEIRFNRKQTDDLVANFSEIGRLAEAIGYRVGQLELGLIQFRYALSIKDFDGAQHTAYQSLEMAERLNNSYYIGRALNNIGIIRLYYDEAFSAREAEADQAAGHEEKHYEVAYRYFLKAANYLEQTPACSDLSRAYNNLGVVSLNYMQAVEKARDYFDKALKILVKHNVVEGKATYLLNLGETYAVIGDEIRALRYYHEAEQVAEDTQNAESLILVTMNLLETYMQVRNFKEAYRYLQKFEREFEPLAAKSWDLDIKRYYYLCGVFYLRMREVMLAKAYFDKVTRDDTFLLDSVGRYRYLLIRYVFDHIISENRDQGILDIVELDRLRGLASNATELRYYHEMLLDLCLDLAAMDTPEPIPALIQRMRTLAVEETTETQRIKQAIVLAYFEPHGRVQRIEELHRLYLTHLNMENRMLLHMIMALIYNDEGLLYLSLQHNLDALDIVYEQTMSLPISLRASYVLSDALRTRLHSRIQAIKVRMAGSGEGLGSPDSLEGFFDLGEMSAVFQHPEFQTSILDVYQRRYGLRIGSAEELLHHFKRDQIHNLQLVIRYLAQVTLAQLGAIYAVDEHSVIEDVFSSEDHLDPLDIEALVKQHGDLDMGILVEHRKRLYTERGLAHRKSYMLVPIYSTSTAMNMPHRRRYDNGDSGYREVQGYLYLESSKLLNNINQVTFDKVLQLVNMVYVMLDTYKLKKAATIDRLTGVYLRKHIESEFHKELAEAKARGQELSVVMVDIDHFKTVNDTFGHRKGDEVLTRIGDILMHNVRHGDYVGRYGGEEFIILLPKTTALDALSVCEKIRERVKGAKILGEEHPLTISLGLATFPGMAQTEEELIERADQALYESKNLGRDRTTQYDGKVKFGNRRADKLAGILSGNVSKDARVLKAMIDMIGLLSDDGAPKDKYHTALGILLDITEGQEATLIFGESDDYDLYERHRGDDRPKQRSRMPKGIIQGFFLNRTDDYFIHWNDIDDIDRVTSTPNWKSYIVCPLVNQGQNQGLVVVRVPIKEFEFEFKHYNFVKQLAGILAAMS